MEVPEFHLGGRTWRRYAPDPSSLIAPFWWADWPDGSPGGTMAFCAGEILLMESEHDKLATYNNHKGD